ncbi:hypothetical protein [Rhodococcus marinonascens]|uniref:hypothetical protein n=1 Tax=Rhodococcus marinonascens TaxID=38311 RepID=UPI000935476E|nr:hypothetical protein [Rhodococcus marinonascens]
MLSLAIANPSLNQGIGASVGNICGPVGGLGRAENDPLGHGEKLASTIMFISFDPGLPGGQGILNARSIGRGPALPEDQVGNGEDPHESSPRPRRIDWATD